MTIKLYLTEIIREICELYYPKNVDRNIDIMVHRFGLECQPTKTLEDIGDKYNLTRERVRQVEASIIDILTALITHGRYVRRYKLREKSIYLNDLQKVDISRLVQLIVKDNRDFLYYSDDLNAYENGELNLVLECLGYKRNNLDYSTIELNKGWFKESKFQTFEQYFNVIHDVLKENNRIQYFDFLIECNKNIKSFDEGLFLILFDNFVRSASIITINEVKYLELAFNKLSTLDKVERLLSDESILGINDIFRILNKGCDKFITLENIRNQMVSDKRFSPVGKSGQWQLSKEGKFKNTSIFESIKHSLMSAGEPLCIDALFDKVREIRGDTFALKSLKTYLYTKKEDFILLSDGRFALSDWVGKNSTLSMMERRNQKPLGDICEVLSKFMNVNDEKPLSEIVSYFKSLGYVDISIRNRLDSLIKAGNFIDITEAGKRNRVLKLVSLDILKKRKLISEQVHELIIEELEKIKDVKITKGELYYLIKKRMPELNKASFYSYCSSLRHENVIEIKDGNKIYLLLTEG